MLAHSKTDVSSQLLSTEEDRLKVSKALVEMEIENNRLVEEVETVKFDLKNKVEFLIFFTFHDINIFEYY